MGRAASRGDTALAGRLLVVALALLPWRDFRRTSAYLFDAAVTAASCATLVAVYLPNGFDSGTSVRAAECHEATLPQV